MGATAPLSANAEQQLARATAFFKSQQSQKLDRFDRYIAPADAVYYSKGQDMELLYHEALEVYRGLFASFPDRPLTYKSISSYSMSKLKWESTSRMVLWIASITSMKGEDQSRGDRRTRRVGWAPGNLHQMGWTHFLTGTAPFE